MISLAERIETTRSYSANELGGDLRRVDKKAPNNSVRVILIEERHRALIAKALRQLKG